MPPQNLAIDRTILMYTPAKVIRSAAFSFLKKYFLVIGVECFTKLSWNILIFEIYFLTANLAESNTESATAVAPNIPRSSLVNFLLISAGINTSSAAKKTFPWGRCRRVSLGRNNWPHNEKDSSGPERTVSSWSCSSSSWWPCVWLWPICIERVDLCNIWCLLFDSSPFVFMESPWFCINRWLENDWPLKNNVNSVHRCKPFIIIVEATPILLNFSSLQNCVVHWLTLKQISWSTLAKPAPVLRCRIDWLN